MKKTNKIMACLAFLALSQVAIAQIDLTQLDEGRKRVYPDTLVLETESKRQLTIAFYKMSDDRKYLSNDLWQSILSTMKSAVIASEYSEGLEVSYQKVKLDGEQVAKVEVKPLVSAADVFVIDKEGIREMPSNRLEFKIFEPYVTFSFFVTDLDQLEELSDVDIESVWGQVEMKYKNYGKRDIYRGDGLIKFGKANIENITSRRLGTDAIELSAGVGLGFYRDRFVPDLGFKMGFNIPDRLGKQNLEFGLLYTQHYFFDQDQEGKYDLNLNGFISGYYFHKFLKDYEVGFAIGVLAHRDGGFFEGNVYKMSLYTSGENSGFNFTPELIFVNGFKDAFPALRIGLTF